MKKSLARLSPILAGCVVTACVYAISVFAAAGPSIIISEMNFEFGERSETTTVSHDFVVKNAGNAVLHINDVRPSCGCTLARFDKTIPPGGEGKITLKLDLKGFQGYVKKSAAVLSDDPSKPRLTLFLEGSARPLIEVRPEKTVFLQGMPDTIKEKTIDLIASTQPFHIRKVDFDLEKKAEYRLETVEEGKHYRVKISNLVRLGTYRGSITLHTDLAEKPEVTIWVNGSVEGEIAVRPNLVVVGQMSADQPVISGKVLVFSNREKPFKIVKCAYDEKIVRVTQAPFPNETGYGLEVVPNMENIPRGSRLQTTLTVETDVPSAGKFEVQIQAINLSDK